jgi:sialate O-acetylesterase
MPCYTDSMPLKVSPLIGGGMVLQEGAAVPVRGEAAPGAEVTVSFLGKTYHATADSGGAWRLLLDSSPCGGPYAMEITAGNEKIALDDIYVGDVWLCSGQSNMEMPMQRVKDNFPEEWEPPINASIRQFKVPQEWEFSGPRKELSGGCWKAASAQTLDEFFATAWFFARALYEKRPRPVGLISAAWGGTPIEAWMSREALAAEAAAALAASDFPPKAEIARDTGAVIREWETNLAHEDLGLPQNWQNPAADIAAWGDITLPGDFAAAGLVNFCGVLWLAKDFDAPASFAANDAKIWLGTITDADTVYVNGVEVGSTTYRYPPRKYRAGAGLLKKGKNRIVIRVTCNNGEGGVTCDKPFRVFTHNESAELAGTWKYKIGAATDSRPEEFFLQRRSMGLFNAMIAPVLDYPCKGVIWYQGESNDPHPREYAALFTALINDWRHKKQSPELPFLFVQLPIFGEPEDNNEASSWAIIREAQRSALSLPATGMAAGLELGEWNDLHPLNKKGIGRRLALAAEKVVYGQPNTSPGPMVRGVERQGNRLLITFDNCGRGLVIRNSSHGGTESTEARRNIKFYLLRVLRASNRRLHRASVRVSSYVSVVAGGESFRLPADIDGPDCLSIDISTVKNPEKVLYAWANNPRDRQLCNADGLPVIPFQIKL